MAGKYESVIVVGIDPGLANTGWCAMTTGGDLVGVGYIGTAKEARKRGLHSGSDDGRRLDEMSTQIADMLGDFLPDLVAYELPSAAKAARAAHAMGLAHACVRTTAYQYFRGSVPLVEVTVLDARRAAAGVIVGRVPEETAHAAVRAQYASHLAGFGKGRLPHVMDAICVALAALRTPVGLAVARGEIR